MSVHYNEVFFCIFNFVWDDIMFYRNTFYFRIIWKLKPLKIILREVGGEQKLLNEKSPKSLWGFLVVATLQISNHFLSDLRLIADLDL